ncbi:MMPL family transporter [Streptomyces sp. WMMC500]|uniref:MMPL family transporter n=1 Tax=Streptomyces sp. WMMC500 TaxID=3015154 RepID=UPI00248B7290|nr:MMPL family transporter [Streptomyces sp. WMMC500]WBB63123.1 MMPL family transporter [Streptomyces sp. WMMC500]
MATFLYRLGRLAFRRRLPVVLLWAAVLAVVGMGGLSASDPPEDSTSMPGIEAQHAFDLIDERFPGAAADGADARVVFVAPAGEKITGAQNRAAVDAFVADIAEAPQVAGAVDPFDGPGVSDNGTTAYATVTYEVTEDEVSGAARTALDDAIDEARDAGLTVEAGGSALESSVSAGIGEVIGIAVAAVVLLITFGSLAAAGLPLITALVGIGVSMFAILALGSALGLSSTVGELAMMLGIAVGIDYSLFVVSRYREERAAGHEPREAAGRAAGTAGSAVVFAGLTVVIALAGLAVIGVPMLTKMGLGAAGAVLVGVLVALTLVPALLGWWPDAVLSRGARGARGARRLSRDGADGGGSGAGWRVGRRWRAGRTSPGSRTPLPARGSAADVTGSPDGTSPPAPATLGVRWARFVLSRPVPVLLATVAGLGILAVPATDLRLGMPGDEAKPTSTTERRAYDALAEGFGPGFNGPLTVVVDARGADDPEAAVAGVAETIGGTDGVVSVSPPRFDEPGETAVLSATPATAPTSERTKDLVHDIRGQRPATEAATGATYEVTGTTALNIDVGQKLQDALIPYLATIIGLAFLLLVLVFRSVLVPLKAALGFLLSVLAALGAVVTVFQQGHLAGLFGVEQTGPVMSMMPIFLVGIVFGLAMDYQVFLVSRMREAYVHGEDAREAVVSGFRHSARVVAVAAVIMMAVFAGFMTGGEQVIKMIGFGLAVAVFFDAVVVRMAFVPAVLALLGKRAWWLPRPLDRLLPRVDVEGEALGRGAPDLRKVPDDEPDQDLTRV